MASLASGSQLGPYEILARLGAGGMGEVWRARDPRLNRDVAIKTSHAQFSERFLREARALAALNHPHICQIFDVGPDYLVMELIEGAPVVSKDRPGPLPMDQALKLAIQLASAMEAAYRKGIAHRDLKPANILVTKSGVKVLDFGLAKFAEAKPEPLQTPGPPGPNDATLSMALTGKNEIVGTLQYMSPEQLQGKEADARSDIFAFGCVLYEMLTGKRAFEAASAASVIAAILERPAPSISEVAPAALDRVLKRCLAKDPDDRYQTARDLRADLEWIASGADATGGSTAPTVPAQAKTRAPWLAWGVAALLLVGFASVSFLHFRETPPAVPVIRTAILPPPKTTFDYLTSVDSAPPTLSPDGRLLVFGARGEDGKSQLYVRPLDALEAQPLAGTEGAIYPFWSPDSRSIAFAADGKLKKIDVAGGPATTLADAPNFRGGAWSQEGVIVFAPARNGALRRVAASGGNATDATSLDVSPGTTSHRWPWFLPDERHFLYAATTTGSDEGDIRIGSLDANDRNGNGGRALGKSNSQAVYSSGIGTNGGYLLYLRGDTLVAQAFDAQRFELTGEAVPVAEKVPAFGNTLRAAFSISLNSALAYMAGGTANLGLVWFDRAGKRTGTVGDPAILRRLQLSPDGKRAAASANTAGNTDIWIYDLARNLRSRFTFDPALDLSAVWSPDGKSIVFNSNRRGHFDLYRKVADGTGTEDLLYGDGTDKQPTSWSQDGKYLLYHSRTSNGANDIFALPLDAGGKPIPFVKTNFNKQNPQFSLDGRWVAYESNESGNIEIYLASFPGGGGKRQVSAAGGTEPRWRADGKELFFIAPDGKLMAAEINLKGDNASVGMIRPLFGGLSVPVINGYHYDVSPDGQRILAIESAEQTGPAEPITLVQNWMAALKQTPQK